MIELAGLLYGLTKDIAAYLGWDEEEKLVDFQWPETSGFKSDAEAEDYDIRWTRPDNIESRQLEGFEILYEIDKLKRIMRRIVLRDGLTLMGRKPDKSTD